MNVKFNSIFLFCLLFLLCRGAQANQTPYLSEYLLEHEVVARGYQPSQEERVVILTDIPSKLQREWINPNFLGQLIKLKLDKAHVLAFYHMGNFKRRYDNNQLNVKTLLDPKIIVSVRSQDSLDSVETTIRIEVVYLEYRLNSSSTQTYHAVPVWRKRYPLSALNFKNLEASLASNLQRDIETFLKKRQKENRVSHLSRQATKTSKTKNKDVSNVMASQESYRLNWKGKDSKLHLIRMGALIGLPRGLGFHVSSWGPESLPYLVSVNAMTLGDGRRWIIGSVGGVWDRIGDIKQGLGLSLSSLDHHYSGVLSQSTDTRGQLTVEEGDVTTWGTYLGATYFLTWKSMQLQTGVLFRVKEINQHPKEVPSFQAIFQIGFTPAALEL